MKNILKILILLISFICKAQDSAEISKDSIYNSLINHTPKNFSIDEASKPKNRLFEIDLNSIGRLQMFYEFQSQLELNEDEIKWLEKQIDQIASAFYLEGNPVLIRKTGGYEGCTDTKFYKEVINGKEISILNFCFTCSGAGNLDDFIKIFNNRTKKLLK